MIKFTHTVTASPEQMFFIIEGMRNPMNSWEKSDSFFIIMDKKKAYIKDRNIKSNMYFEIGDEDFDLMKKLVNAGSDDRKFLRQMPVYVRITAPLYWWKEFDTYKIGTVSNSCSTMHKIHEKEFTLDDFSYDQMMEWADYEEIVKEVVPDRACDYMSYLLDTITALNNARDLYLETKDKRFWWQMIQLLPSSYNQIRNVSMNYEVLRNMYHARKNHKLDEWRIGFCDWVKTLPYSELITGEK